MPSTPTDNRNARFSRVARSWFELTTERERVMTLIFVSIFLLGVLARHIHLKSGNDNAKDETSIREPAERIPND